MSIFSKLQRRIVASIERRWYSNAGILLLLLPLSWVFLFLSRVRHNSLSKQKCHLPVPVVIVGNISVGGTGKTPVIAALAQLLKDNGFTPGIISKGYGRNSTELLVVNKESTVEGVGDEPLLLYHATQCAVGVGPARSGVGYELMSEHGCDVLLCDDGMQDYRLGRDLELAIMDGQRLLGNGYVLPVGPLREPPKRLRAVDHILVNTAPLRRQGSSNVSSPAALNVNSALYKQLMGQLKRSGVADDGLHEKIVAAHVQPVAMVNVQSGEKVGLDVFNKKEHYMAVAGIGSPQRFFDTLIGLGIQSTSHSFADHHHFTAEDFLSLGEASVIMTEKDAVKCKSFAKPNWWFLEIRMVIDPAFCKLFVDSIRQRQDKKVIARAM